MTGQRVALDYIAELAGQLAAMAAEKNCECLAHLLRMASLEARQQLERTTFGKPSDVAIYATAVHDEDTVH